MSEARHLHLVAPGDIDTRTGGYEYDRRIISGLRARGWKVSLVSVPGTYPFPAADDRAAAARRLADIPDGARVLVDGLALGVLPGEAAAEHRRLCLVALVHHPLHAETGLTRSQSDALRESERQALQVVRGIVVTSPRTVESVAAFGIPRERIAVVEPGTDRAPAARGSGGPGLRTMLCVASVVPRKGHDTLFAALAPLRDLPWHLTCVGSLERDAAWAAQLVRQVRDAHLEDRITFAGELEGHALEAAYQEADLFVLPTRYEGFGMAVAEALARGIPVISTDTGGIVDLVGDRAGMVIPADNVPSLAGELKRLLTDAGDFARLRRGAVATRDRLATWDTAAQRMEEALLRLVAA